MAQLVLLVVAAAWIAVLLPPMLRSRVENRPNSSVTDFRRQLTKLQNTAAPRGAMRSMGRPLAQSPLQRPAASGRPSSASARSGVSVHGAAGEPAVRTPAPVPASRAADRVVDEPIETSRYRARGGDQLRYRSHGDPSGSIARPASRRNADPRGQYEDHSRRAASRPTPVSDVKRRRTNVLFALLIITGCTLFLAATTSSTVMLYLFALSFLGLCGYVYLLAQLRERTAPAYDGWFENSY